MSTYGAGNLVLIALSAPLEGRMLEARTHLDGTEFDYYALSRLPSLGLRDPDRLPCTVKILLEMLLRDERVPPGVIADMASWTGRPPLPALEIPFRAARVLLHNYTGTPALVDLVSMGILPLQDVPGQNREVLGLTGREAFSVRGLADGLTPGKRLDIEASDAAGVRRFTALARVDTASEMEYLRHGGVFPMILRRKLAEA